MAYQLRALTVWQRSIVDSQHPNNRLQSSVTTVPGHLAPYSGLPGHQVHTWNTDTCAAKTPIHMMMMMMMMIDTNNNNN